MVSDVDNKQVLEDFFNKYGLIVTKNILNMYEIKEYINDNTKELTYEKLLEFARYICEVNLQGIKHNQMMLKSKAKPTNDWCSYISIPGGSEDYD